jgi:hypothetical protein
VAVGGDLGAIRGYQGIFWGQLPGSFMEEQVLIDWFGAVDAFGDTSGSVQTGLDGRYVFTLLLQLFPESIFDFVALILAIFYFAGVILEAILNLDIVDGHARIITKASRFAIQAAF